MTVLVIAPLSLDIRRVKPKLFRRPLLRRSAPADGRGVCRPLLNVWHKVRRNGLRVGMHCAPKQLISFDFFMNSTQSC